MLKLLKKIFTTVATTAFTLTMVTTISSNGVDMFKEFASMDVSEQVACVTEFDATEFTHDLFGYDDNKAVAVVLDAAENINSVDADELTESTLTTIADTLSSTLETAME